MAVTGSVAINPIVYIMLQHYHVTNLNVFIDAQLVVHLKKPQVIWANCLFYIFFNCF